MKRALAALCLLCSLAALGCEPNLSAVTVAPPTKTAELSNEDETIELSKGIALGFECTFQGAPCKSAKATIAEPEIALVFEGYVDLLAPKGPSQYASAMPRSVFVIVGNKPGTTRLDVSTEKGDVSFDVTIVE